MRRVLTDHGSVVLSVWQGLNRHPIYQALFEATAERTGAMVSDLALSFSLSDADQLRALLNDAGFQQMEVTPRSLDIHLSSPEHFVQFTVLSAATSIPAFSQLDATERSRLVKDVTQDMEAIIRRNRVGDKLAFSMSTHIAVTRK